MVRSFYSAILLFTELWKSERHNEMGITSNKLTPDRAPIGAPLLAFYFFLIICSYYQIKPLSRSLFMGSFGSGNFPYIWIAGTVVLSVLMPIYQMQLKRFSRATIVFASTWIMFALLIVFRFFLTEPSQVSVAGFYILTDIYGVLLVENFWSLTNSSFTLAAGKLWYGVISSGGMLGGLIGSILAATLLEKAILQSVDLVFVCLIFLVLSVFLVRFMFSRGLVSSKPLETSVEAEDPKSKPSFKFVQCLAGLLLVAQLVEPVVEYLLLQSIERSVSSLEDRTQFLSLVFTGINTLGLVTNLLFLPIFNRYVGWISSLLIQPLSIIVVTISFLWSQSLNAVALLKIVDRGLSYSSGRVSREFLYLHLPSADIFRIKAWVDMYGYRFFKIFGSGLVLGVTMWVAAAHAILAFCLVLIALTLVWLYLIFRVTGYLGTGSKIAINPIRKAPISS